jgi:hypothetical protein
MHNYHAMEIEAEFRRREWQRAVEADARAVRLRTGNERKPWRPLSLTRVRSLAASRLPFVSLPVPRRCQCRVAG